MTFEFGMGTPLGYLRERMLAHYNLARGGFMGFGLVFLLFAPMLGASLRSDWTLNPIAKSSGNMG